MNRLLASISLSAALALGGCAAVISYVKQPTVKAAGIALADGVVAYTGGNSIGAAIDATEAVAYLIRSAQGTPNAATPAKIKELVSSAGAGSKVLASPVAAAITALVTQGVAPDTANETVASALDALTKAKAKPSASLSPMSLVLPSDIEYGLPAREPRLFRRLRYDPHLLLRVGPVLQIRVIDSYDPRRQVLASR